MLASIGPVLRHLVATESHAIFSEEVIARTRGLIETLAVRLVRQSAQVLGRAEVRALICALEATPELLSHCHALTLEAQLSERLAQEARLDPVLSPLLQARIADSSPETAAMAMTLLAAQARFIQTQRRMELVPNELPADLLHAALSAFASTCGSAAEPVAAALRAGYDEARSRAALLGRVVLELGDAHDLALEPDQAGVAIFITALALMTGHERDAVVLATTAGQQARLALLLLAAGLAPSAVEAVLLRFHPDAAIPRISFEGLTRERAVALLATESDE